MRVSVGTLNIWSDATGSLVAAWSSHAVRGFDGRSSWCGYWPLDLRLQDLADVDQVTAVLLVARSLETVLLESSKDA